MNANEEISSKLKIMNNFFDTFNEAFANMQQTDAQTIDELFHYFSDFSNYPTQSVKRICILRFEAGTVVLMKFIIKFYLDFRLKFKNLLNAFMDFIRKRDISDICSLETNLILSLQKNYTVVPSCSSDIEYIDKSCLENAKIAVIDILELYLSRFTVRDYRIYSAVSKILISFDPLIDMFQILRCFAMLCPSSVTDSWIMISSLMYFIQQQINIDNGSIFKLSTYNELDNNADKLCARCFFNATYRLQESIKINFGQNIIQILKVFRSIAKTAPLFLNSYFAMIKVFVESDLSNSNLVEPMMFENFQYFCNDINFLMACKSLISRSKSFLSKLLEFYRQEKSRCIRATIEKALLRMDEKYEKYIETEDLETCLQLSLISPYSKFTSIVDKNIDIAMTIPTVSYKNLIIICQKKHEYINLFENLSTEDILKFHLEFYPDLEKTAKEIFRSQMAKYTFTTCNKQLDYLVVIFSQYIRHTEFISEIILRVSDQITSPIDYEYPQSTLAAQAYLILKDETSVSLYICGEFQDLFKDTRYIHIIHVFLSNKKYRLISLERIIELISTGSETVAAVAYFALAKFKGIRELYHQYPDVISKDLYQLYKRDTFKFNEVCQVICGHTDATQLLFGLLADYIAGNNILEINKLVDKDCKLENELCDKAKEQIIANIPKIIHIILVGDSMPKYINTFKFFEKYLQKPKAVLIDESISQISSDIIMSLYSDDLNEHGVVTMRNFLDDIFGIGRPYLLMLLDKALIPFQNILQSDFCNMKVTVLKAIFNIFNSHAGKFSIHPTFWNTAKQLLYSTMNVLEIPELRIHFFKIWANFIGNCVSYKYEFPRNHNIDGILHIVYPLIMVTLTYESDDQKTNNKILDDFLNFPNLRDERIFIFDNFTNSSDFRFDVSSFISLESQRLDDEKISILSELLLNAPPILAKIILKQMLQTVRTKNLGEISRRILVKNVVHYLQKDVPEDIIILTGRCLSFITDIDNYSDLSNIPLNKDSTAAILEHIINNYLRPLMYDQKIWHYEIAARAISKAYKLLGRKEESEFTYMPSLPPISVSNKMTPFKLIQKFLHKGCPFKLLKRSCSISVSLCRFLFPYLIKNDPKILSDLKSLITDLFSNVTSQDYIEMTYFIMSMYRPMCELGINIGSGFGDIQIKVDNNLIIAAAIRCQQYEIALRYIHFKINFTDDSHLKTCEEIYTELDDNDGLNYIREKVHKNVTPESVLLDSHSTEKERLNALKLMLDSGNFSRALSDSFNLYRGDMQNVELCNIMAGIALRMQSWDMMSTLSRQKFIDGFEISLVRAISYFQKQEESLFVSEVQQIRKALSKLLQDYATRSPDTIAFITWRFRIIEDLYNSYINKYNDESTKKWMFLPSICTDIAEIATSVSCLTADVTKNSYLDKYAVDKTDMMIELAKICRKNDMFMKANFYCEKGFVSSPRNNYEIYCKCVIEQSKLYITLGEYKNAYTTINEFRPFLKEVNDNELVVQFHSLHGQTMHLSQVTDLNQIQLQYKKASKKHAKGASIYYRLARICDDLVMLKLNEIVNIERNKSRLNEKFNEVSSNPSIELLNFRNNICMALQNYFLAMKNKESLGKEVLPRVFYLFFDIGNMIFNKLDKQYPPSNQSIYQHMSLILFSMFDVFWCYISQISPFLLSSSIVSIISRFKISRQFQPAWQQLIKTSIPYYVHHVFWFLSYLINQEREKPDPAIQDIFNIPVGAEYLRGTLALKKLAQGTAMIKNVASDKSLLLPEFQNCQKIIAETELMLPITYCFNSKSTDLPFITQLCDEFEILESAMHPLKLKFLSTDGRKLNFILKRDKDMRKDMRVIDLFTFINSIFMRDNKCKQRNFSVTTYAVVCLSEQASLMEWVQDTTTFRQIFDPAMVQDINNYYFEWRSRGIQTRINAINGFRQKYPHQTHSYYCKKFPNPAQWFRAQLSYIKSTAAYSMIGRVLGLGDRHLENILINYKNGAVVHIDFDSIFDACKKRESVPETVSYRLTHCIRDGFGVTDVDGTFAQSCVIVQEALQAKRRSLLNILHSFVYDPLIDMTWTNPALLLDEIERRISLQSNDRNSVINTNFAILFMNKDAMNPNNLARMWVGWLPYV